MAVLPRKLQTIFASQLAASGNIAQPGSTALGTPVYSTDLDILQKLSATTSSPWVNGLQDQCIGTQSQVLEELNGILYEITQQVAYLLERGCSEWLATQNYYLNAISFVNGVSYTSLQNNNLNNAPASQPTWWKLTSSTRSPSTIPAFVVFDATSISGGNCRILNSSNVSSVQKLGTGYYLVNFINAMTVDGSDGIYGFSGSAGTRNGAAGIAGDNNIICGGGFSFPTGLKTAMACNIFNWDADVAGGGQLEDSQSISVLFFG